MGGVAHKDLPTTGKTRARKGAPFRKKLLHPWTARQRTGLSYKEVGNVSGTYEGIEEKGKRRLREEAYRTRA